MSEAKFSKGPWHIKWPIPSKGMGRRLFTADGEPIMANDTYYPWTPSNTRDWFLIAQAPEMYKFLDDLANGRGIDYPIEQLLAKARGEK